MAENSDLLSVDLVGWSKTRPRWGAIRPLQSSGRRGVTVLRVWDPSVGSHEDSSLYLVKKSCTQSGRLIRMKYIQPDRIAYPLSRGAGGSLLQGASGAYQPESLRCIRQDALAVGVPQLHMFQLHYV